MNTSTKNNGSIILTVQTKQRKNLFSIMVKDIKN